MSASIRETAASRSVPSEARSAATDSFWAVRAAT
jgi:hypothetical protein